MNTTRAVGSFLSGLNSEHTRRTYGTALKHFCAFLEERGTEAPTVDHAISFVAWLRERGPARETFKLYLTVVHRFYRYLLTRGTEISATDLARLEEVYRDARNIRGESRPIDYRIEAVEAVIRTARRVPTTLGHTTEKRRRELARLRDIAIVETLRATGSRVGELVGLRLDDISKEGKSALVKGKGSKYRHVYWDDVAWRALLAYLGARGVIEANQLPVFCGHGNRASGDPLSTRHVDRIVRELGRRAKVQDVTPHYFRHVFATRALEVTGNLALVQDMLGHASPTTTRVYARTNDEQRKNAHAQVWA